MIGRFLDITSLTGNETEQDIENLLVLATNGKPEGHPSVAAVCVYPKWVEYVSDRLWITPIGIATVLNFPYGENNVEQVINEAYEAIENGANELDIVVPFKDGIIDLEGLYYFVSTIVVEFPLVTTKFILETSVLSNEEIRLAASICMKAGADYIKTCTGKNGAATENAVKIISEQILKYYKGQDRKVGIKVSGGVKSFQQAMRFYHTSKSYIGHSWNNLFRIGAGLEGSKAILKDC